jgi:hypothetical protein
MKAKNTKTVFILDAINPISYLLCHKRLFGNYEKPIYLSKDVTNGLSTLFYPNPWNC